MANGAGQSRGLVSMTEMGLSERRSCRIFDLPRSVQQYRPLYREDAAVLERLRTLASENWRYGYPRLRAMLRREGLIANRKRTLAALQRRGTAGAHEEAPQAAAARSRWSAPTEVVHQLG
jgi:hypothetical protein